MVPKYLPSKRFHRKGLTVRRKGSDKEIKEGEDRFVSGAHLLESMHYSRGNQTGKKKLCYQIKKRKEFFFIFVQKKINSKIQS